MNAAYVPLALARRSIASERALALTRAATTRQPNLLFFRHAASTAKPVKARVLEQPDKFRPPSHPARLRTKPRAYPGPPLSDKDREAQKVKQYPHMMPPEGSMMHKFLTSRSLHTWITLSVLVSLAFFTILTNFLSTTPYREQLPPNNLFFSHPIRFLRRWWEVYQMHTDYVTAQTIARREAKVDDVRKRSEFRRAHGIDEEKGIGGWTFKGEGVATATLADAEREGGQLVMGDGQSPVEGGEDVGKREYVDFGGERKKVKKWLGIW